MSKIQPWSPSALDQFTNCPKQFFEVRVAKSVPRTETEQQVWGNYVHKSFEACQEGTIIDGAPVMKDLPDDLHAHYPYMQKLWDKPGHHFVEMKGGFDKKGQPCNFFDNDVWCRIVIDYHKLDPETGLATIVDYKTGKPHSKFEQLYIYCLWIFAMYPYVDLINAQFYWTKTLEVTKKIVSRDEIPDLWAKFIPNLRQYKEAFTTDVWQERPSGLCHGWCPVEDCQHWRPRRV